MTAVGRYLYVMGGSPGGPTLRSVERYDPHSDRWEDVAPMPRPRKGARAVTFAGKIIVLGGIQDAPPTYLADIDIYDPQQVEWAMATRFQGDQDMLVLPRERGSSLDPSAETDTHLTTKIGFDLTKPLRTKGKKICSTI